MDSFNRLRGKKIIFEKDYLTWLNMFINDVSDIILVSITPLTATISANAVIDYKDY